MKAPSFDYVRAQSLDQVFTLLAKHGDDAKIVAGGQSLMPMLNMRLAAPSLLIDITGLDDLSGITRDGGVVTIGALTRHVAVETDPLIARHVPLLAQAIVHVAHPAIRNRGTFGGSLANADPAAELPACMVALGARLKIAGRGGIRRVPARDFFRGLYETALQAGDVLLGAEIDVDGPGTRSAFGELARRQGDYALVGLAAHGPVDAPRLVFFGVGDRPVEAAGAAAALSGRRLDGAAIAAAQAALGGDLSPPSDTQASAEARGHMARVLLARVLMTMGNAA